MTATFSAPFTGIAFSFEELKENKNHIVFVCIALSSIFSILVIEHILGQSMILNFNLPRILEVRHYISLLPLGLICGLLASFQNILMNTFSKFYQKIKNDILRPVPAFIVAGIMIMFFPYVLGSGDLLIGSIVMDKFPIHMLFILIFVKLFYTSVCSTSGAVGGVFFPTFILGSSIGSLYDIFFGALFSRICYVWRFIYSVGNYFYDVWYYQNSYNGMYINIGDIKFCFKFCRSYDSSYNIVYGS